MADNNTAKPSSKFWDSVYRSDDSFFGSKPSVLARESMSFLKEKDCTNLIEFGCGQGRDALFFARKGLDVLAVDYSTRALSQLKRRAGKMRLKGKIKTLAFDLAQKPSCVSEFDEVDAIYSHLFYCMPFSDEQLIRIVGFAYETLRRGGLHIFSVRNKDKDIKYGEGKQIGKNTFRTDGFTIRFFSKQEILKLNEPFRLLKVTEAFEEPCSLLLVFSIKE